MEKIETHIIHQPTFGGNWRAALLGSALLLFGTVQAQYCTPTLTDNVEPICNVSFAGINNTTDGTLNGTPAVEDFTAITANVSQGLSYPISFTGNSDGNFVDYFTVFFDWDQDGTLETMQEIGSFANSNCGTVVSGTVSVPGTALLGNTRMRVIKDYNGSPTDPCGTYDYGQVEDYTLNVVAASCTPPSATATVVPNCPSGFGVDVDITSFGSGASATINYSINGTAQTPPITVSVLGTTSLTGFVNGDDVDITVAHESDNTCDVTLNNNTYFCPPTNDDCANAIAVACNSTTPGTTTNATNTDAPPTCTTSLNTGPGVWYTAVGSGTDMTAGLCGATWDTKIGIFTGSCGNFTCVAGNDDDCGSTVQSSVTWTSTQGTTYYIYVTGYNTNSGDFNLSLNCASCVPPAATATVVPNCPGGFGVDVDITSFGSGASATINYSVNGTAQTPVPVAALGTTSLTGFAPGDDVDITVAHESDNTCDLVLNNNTYTCPPANDECANAIALTVNADLNCGSVTTGTVAGATNSGQDACSGTEDDDVWFSFTATATSHQISLNNITGSTSDMMMAVYSGSCGNLVNMACSDPETMTASSLTVGTTYLLQVYTWTSTTSQTSTFDVCVGTLPGVPANDDCAGAIALTVNPDLNCGSVTSGTVASATDSGLNPCSGTSDDDVWFSFTATATSHQISLNNITGGTSDMMMAVYSGTCGNLVNLACSDPETMTATGLTVGNTYYLQVYTYTSTTGQTSSFDVCVGTLPAPPANDDCANAIAVGCNSTTPGTTTSANNTDAPTGCSDDLSTAPGVWYTATGNGGDMTAGLCGATWDTKIGIFTGSCGNFTCVASDDDDCDSGPQSVVTWASTAGTTYYIYVTGYQTNSGDFDLSLDCAPPVGPCTGNQVVVNINTDSYSSETSWEVTDEIGTVLASGAPGMDNSLNSDTVCLGTTTDPACYRFIVYDSFGDGMLGDGSWELRTTDGKLILGDLFDDGDQSPAIPTASASYGSGHSFCLPLGPGNIAATECGIFNNQQGNKVYANKVTGATQYQFEFSNPDAGFIRRIVRSTNYVHFWDMVANPLVPGVTYFARVRTNVAGPVASAHFGSGCEMGLAPLVPCTQLIMAPAYGHSCNETRAFNPSTNNSFIYGVPVQGASQYQFRIFNTSEGYDETFTRSTYILQLKWNNTVAPPLANGSTYDVQVNARVGTLWSGFCGTTCTITIDNGIGLNLESVEQTAFGTTTLWPNPVRDGQVNLNIDGLSAGSPSDDLTVAEQEITVDVQDIYGKHVFAQTFGNSGDRFSTTLQLPGDIASGVYMVNITVNLPGRQAGGEKTMQRLSIIR